MDLSHVSGVVPGHQAGDVYLFVTTCNSDQRSGELGGAVCAIEFAGFVH